MPTIDGQYYGQDNPRDQIRIIMGSIKGHASNLEDGAINIEKYVYLTVMSVAARKMCA